MKKVLIAGLIVAFLPIVAFAQQQYKVDTSHSKVAWAAKKVVGGHNGEIKIQEGTVEMDKNVLKGGSFVLDTRTINVLDVNNPRLEAHLKNDDFFAVDKYPSSKFVITKVVAKGGANYEITGKVTIKEVTEEITFPAIVNVANGKLSASAKMKIDRTKFGIKFRSGNFFENLGDRAIEDMFELDVMLTAVL